MSFFTKKKILVTHNGRFHADDIFATATLSILLGPKNIKVIRTRDEGVIASADYVYDVGGIYDEATNRFDHHQIGGAGVRTNGVPYAAFGLVWKAYGETICGSHAVSHQINKKLVQPIDANDNGMDIFTLKGETAPYLIQDVFSLWRPSYKEEAEYDVPFMEMVELAREMLLREIKKTQDAVEGESLVLDAYHAAIDKRIIVLDNSAPWGDILGLYAEPLYVVYQKADQMSWGVSCVRKDKHTYENRKSLPAEWAGLRDAELARVTGVPDAMFCHNARFLAVARSKEGALMLAQKALLA
jgi:uncharacterized UPF0160 family protein